VASARSATALARARARAAVQTLGTSTATVALGARARLAASSAARVALGAARLGAAGRGATAGARGAVGAAELSATPRSSSAAQHAALATAAFRAEPSLAAIGIVNRSGAGALYARGRLLAVWDVGPQPAAHPLLVADTARRGPSARALGFRGDRLAVRRAQDMTNLVATIGDTHVIVLPVVEAESGEPYDVTGAVAWFYGKRRESDADAAAIVAASPGAGTIGVDGSIVTVTVPAAQSAVLTRDTVLFWACRIKEATSAQVTTIDAGELTLELHAVMVNA
jgi:hypothetical protein